MLCGTSRSNRSGRPVGTGRKRYGENRKDEDSIRTEVRYLLPSSPTLLAPTSTGPGNISVDTSGDFTYSTVREYGDRDSYRVHVHPPRLLLDFVIPVYLQ